MEIKRTTTHRVILLKFDEIPFARLVAKSTLEDQASLFEFGKAGVGQDPTGRPVVELASGLFRRSEAAIPIMRLVIEERRILLDIEGTSADADEIYSILREFLIARCDEPNDDLLIPILTSEETELVSRLEISAEALILPDWMSFVQEQLIPAAKQPYADPDARIAQFSFLVTYTITDPRLDDLRITINPKDFVFGPRPGYPISDQVFYSKAPLHSDEHITLLEQLEAQFSRTG